MRHETINSCGNLGARYGDTDVERAAGIAQPDHADATNLETQGNRQPGFSAAKGSGNAAEDSKQ